MSSDNENPAPPVVESVTFKLGAVGAVVLERFADRIKTYGLKPKHLGLMVALDSGAVASQLELARTMGVAPSLMVTLVDQLTALGAVVRERDPLDRRRQTLSLTNHGRSLLAECAADAAALDADLTAGMPAREYATLTRALRTLGARMGMST